MAQKRRGKKKRGRSSSLPPHVLPLPDNPVGPLHEDKNLKSSLKGKRISLPLIVAAGLIIIISLWYFRVFLFPGPVKRERGLNIVIITLDTTRADRLGCYGYSRARTPHIDELASRGVKFLHAYAQVPLTFPSHCSIFTGTYPLYHGARNNGTYRLSPEIITLAEILRNYAYHTAAFVSSFTVDSRFGLDQGFDLYDDSFGEGLAFKASNAERRAEEVFHSFSTWMEKKPSEPFFCWLHFFDPHLPYDPPSPFKEEFAANPYDGEIAYMDLYIGKATEKLREKGLLSRTMLILAGDHGEAFGEKGEEGHGVFLYEGSIKVPLIFYCEKHLPPGKIIKERVRLVDLMPSILDMLRISPPAQVQGESLLPWIERKKRKDLPTYIETFFPRENYGWSELEGIIDGDWKYIQAPREELYNLKDDPEENKNLVETREEILTIFREKLKEYQKRYSSSLYAHQKEVTLEEREKLRSLGYLALAEKTYAVSLPDPKDQIEELKMITRAEMLEFQKRFEEAASIYEEILALRPESPLNYINLALVYARLNRLDEALKVLERGKEKIPRSLLLLSRLAHTYMVAGRLKKSYDIWQEVLRLDPYYFDALLSSGWILDLIGNKDEARLFYEKALAIEPENRFLRKNLAINLATTGKIQEAIAIYEGLVRDYPEDYEVHQDLGIAYGYAGHLDKAIIHLKKAINIRPTPTAYYNLAVAMKKTGNIQEAVKYLKLYLENSAGEDEEKVRNARIELILLEKNQAR